MNVTCEHAQAKVGGGNEEKKRNKTQIKEPLGSERLHTLGETDHGYFQLQDKSKLHQQRARAGVERARKLCSLHKHPSKPDSHFRQSLIASKDAVPKPGRVRRTLAFCQSNVSATARPCRACTRCERSLGDEAFKRPKPSILCDGHVASQTTNENSCRDAGLASVVLSPRRTTPNIAIASVRAATIYSVCIRGRILIHERLCLVSRWAAAHAMRKLPERPAFGAAFQTGQ